MFYVQYPRDRGSPSKRIRVFEYMWLVRVFSQRVRAKEWSILKCEMVYCQTEISLCICAQAYEKISKHVYTFSRLMLILFLSNVLTENSVYYIKRHVFEYSDW